MQGSTKGVPIDTDITLSLNSDLVVPSQKAVVSYLNSKIAGTTNYISKFTASGTVGNSLIQDNNVGIGINSAPNTGSTLYSLTAVGQSISGHFISTDTSSNSYGTYASTVGTNSNVNVGTYGSATNSTLMNIGGMGVAMSPTIGVNIGGSFTATNGTSNYALRLTDGTQAIGKYLKCVGSNGEANWAAPATDLGLTYAISTGNILL